jgi:hypothetical protein
VPTFGNPHDLSELSYPPPREQVAESLLVIPKRPRPRPKATRPARTQDAVLDAEEILEHEVFPWLLKGNVWVLGIHRLVMAFLEVFGSAASPDNWEGRGLAPVGLDKYLELSLELKAPEAALPAVHHPLRGAAPQRTHRRDDGVVRAVHGRPRTSLLAEAARSLPPRVQLGSQG